MHHARTLLTGRGFATNARFPRKWMVERNGRKDAGFGVTRRAMSARDFMQPLPFRDTTRCGIDCCEREAKVVAGIEFPCFCNPPAMGEPQDDKDHPDRRSCAGLFSGGQRSQKFSRHAGIAGPIGRKNRRPPLRWDTFPLPPLRNLRRCRAWQLGRERFAGVAPQLNNRAE